MLILGSGNIAHAIVADTDEFCVILSSNAFTDNGICTINGKECKVTTDFSEASKHDVIISTLPSFAREKVIDNIKKYIKPGTLIGSLPGTAGFNELVHSKIKDVKCFGAQRVPYISRITEKFKSVKYDKKSEISVSFDDNKDYDVLQRILNIDIKLLSSFDEVNLSNSNPLLHTSRLVQLKKSEPFDYEVLFYEDWEDESSELLLKMDEEFSSIVKAKNLSVKSLKEHYEVNNYKELTEKIRSIRAFNGIKAPLNKVDGKYYLDVNSRYFAEDIHYSLKYIIEYAENLNIHCDTMKSVYNFLKD